jgi:hypothetical protein
MPFYIRVPSLITPVHCITQTEEPIYVGTEMMNQKITAIFNGEAFYPTETFNLKPNTKVKLTIETQLIDEDQLQIMADDLDILGEIATINQEFMVSEMDGL